MSRNSQAQGQILQRAQTSVPDPPLRFSSAYQAFQEAEEVRQPSRQSAGSTSARLDLKKSVFAEDEMDKIAITKELFLLIIQDRAVQKLMDDLDLPPDRANLFEIIDGDGSGTLQITELLQGLLKIRGEINKSDAVATLLATRSVQQMITELKEESHEKLDSLRSEILSGLAFARRNSRPKVRVV